MIKRLLFLGWLLVCTLGLSAQTLLQGVVMDGENNEPAIYANVTIESGGQFYNANTDYDGFYTIELDPGTYDVQVSYAGAQTQTQTGVLIPAGKITVLDFTLMSGLDLDVVVFTAYKIPVVDREGGTGGNVTGEQIAKLPGKDLTSIVSTIPGLSGGDGRGDDQDLNVKGGRTNATDYYLDGVRIRGPLPPQSEIEQIEVLTGGIEARYGDVTGGIIAVTSKGPSKEFQAQVELETSEFLDPFGYNLAYVNISSPLIKRMDEASKLERSVLGLRLSAQYRSQKDDAPGLVDQYIVSDSRREEAEKDPVVFLGTSPYAVAETYTTVGKEGDDNVDVWRLKYRPNERAERLDLTAKLDAAITEQMQLTMTGTYYRNNNRFTPSGWRLLNSNHNPYDLDNRYRGILRFRHRLYNPLDTASQSGVFQRLSYTIQAGYERGTSLRQDDRHKDNFFNYGHVAKFTDTIAPVFAVNPETGDLEHIDYRVDFSGYDASTSANPGLAVYNQYAIPSGDGVLDLSEFNQVNGLAQTTVDQVWGSLSNPDGSLLYRNVNQVYNFYEKTSQDLITGQFNVGFDLVPGKNRRNNHSVNFGVLYEQRNDTRFALQPRRLWILANDLANSNHSTGVDTTQVLYTNEEGVDIHPYAVSADPTGQFWKSIRAETGVANNEFQTIDNLDPSQLSLGMFSGSELTGYRSSGTRILSYYGYDYTGKQVKGATTFSDFFRKTDENGNRTFPVAPNRPTYTAFYLQDKFVVNEAIFKVGVRVDRYDANTKVLKDPLSFYPVMSAKQFYEQFTSPTPRPGTIGDDFKVYVNGESSTVVTAFRDGETWYTPEGTQESGVNIFGGSIVTPQWQDEEIDITSDDFNPDDVFEDYEPQWNVSPRLSFSFPISDKSNFFAHYDVLISRPRSNTIATALDYYHFLGDNGVRNNPDLKPEKNVDYAVGFQQAINQSSAIKLSAYYREMRDMIQRRTYQFVPTVGQYDTYGNIDFSTIKGFTFQYDLRKTKNFSMLLAYTLQFADGTGSDANAQRSTGQNGNLRTVIPLDFDERHRIQANLDYRWGRGKQYFGPSGFWEKVLQELGLNLILSSVSGRPYTAARSINQAYGGQEVEGSLNSSRKPWTFRLDGRMDKNFRLTKVDARRPVYLNMYLRVQNIFNTQNVTNVYPYTGSAEDDGFLPTISGQNTVAGIEGAGRNVDSFLDFYNWGLQNATYFGLPRRIYLGAIIDF